MYLTTYMIPILTRLSKNLNNMTSYELISILFEIKTMLFPKNEAYYIHQLIAT